MAGRPYKGERLSVTVKVPMAYGKKLERYCEVTGQTKQDVTALAVMEALDEIDLEAVEGQGRLPMTA